VNDTVGDGDIRAIDSLCFQVLDTVKRMEDEKVPTDLFDKEMSGVKFTTTSYDGRTVELITGGSAVSLCWANKDQFSRELRRHVFSEFAPQVEAIKRGMASVLPQSLLSIFTWRELETQVCGRGMTREDVTLLQKNTMYSTHKDNEPLIEWFWQILRDRFDDDQRSLFLMFVWGRSRLPLSSDDFERKMCIQSHSESQNGSAPNEADKWLPASHTCSFALDLPKYSSFDVLLKQLTTAITTCGVIDGD